MVTIIFLSSLSAVIHNDGFYQLQNRWQVENLF